MGGGRLRAPLALLASVVIVATLAACGDDDSSSNTAEVQREAQAKADAKVKARNAKVLKEYRERNATAPTTPDERQAEQATASFYAILGAERAPANKNKTTVDSEAFCELMSEKAVAQTINYAKVSSGFQQRWDCESAVDLLVIRSKRTGGFKGAARAKVIGVNAQGDRATATVRFGSGPATSIPLVREDGEWKLAASPTTDAN